MQWAGRKRSDTVATLKGEFSRDPARSGYRSSLSYDGFYTESFCEMHSGTLDPQPWGWLGDFLFWGHTPGMNFVLRLVTCLLAALLVLGWHGRRSS